MKYAILILATTLSISVFGQNQNISNQNIYDGEPYIAINPSNSQEMVVAWMGFVVGERVQIKTKFSTDAGKTWSTVSLVAHPVSGYTSADPSLAFDANGHVYLSFIDFTGFTNPNIQGAVYLSKSTNLGQTWNTPTLVIHTSDDPGKRNIDRPWMVIDKSGTASQGNIYITTMNAKGSTFGYNPYISISTDGGNTFSWRYLDTANFLSGNLISQPMPTPAVSNTGEIHAIYPSYVISQNFKAQFLIASSTDNGNSFSYKPVFESSSSVTDSLAKKGYLLISNPTDGNHLVFLYLDNSNDKSDVFMVESTDAGIIWSTATKVNDDNTNALQDLVWADFDTDGDLIVSWRDRRNGSSGEYTTDSEIWASVRMKDSTNFSANFRVSDTLVAYDNVLANSGNDFMCVDFRNDTLNAVWGETRTGKLNIWFSRIGIDGSIVSVQNLANEEYPIVQPYPNPVTNQLTFEIQNQSGTFILEIFDIKGEQIVIKEVSGKTTIATNNWASGTYIYKIAINGVMYSGNIIKP